MWYPLPGSRGNTVKRNRHLSPGPLQGRWAERPPLTSFKAVMILDLKMARAHSRAISQNVSIIPEDWTPFLLSS